MRVSFNFALIQNLNSTSKIQDFFIKVLKSKALQYALSPCGLLKDSHQIVFVLEGEEDNILAFSQALSQAIPLSLQWCFKEIAMLEDNPYPTQVNQVLSSPKDLLTPYELELISNPESENFCNLWLDFIDFHQTKLTYFDNAKKQIIKNSKDLKNALDALAQKLKANQSIFIKTRYGKKRLWLFDEKQPKTIGQSYYFMPFCLNAAQMFFRTQNEELQALASIEKPILSLRPKSVFVPFFPSKEVLCVLPYEPLLLLLTKFLADYEGCYLEEINPDEEKIDSGLCYFIPEDSAPLKVNIAKNALVVCDKIDKGFEPQSFLQTIKQEQCQRVNILYFGEETTRFLLYFQESFKETLNFKIPVNLKDFLNYLKSNSQTTQKLLENFTQNYPNLIEKLTLMPSQKEEISHNLLDLLGVCGIFLGLSEDFDLIKSRQLVLDYARDFMGTKGVRIDFALENKEGEILLNAYKTIRSVMSFRLAGVEKELLCFGIVDSLAEFLANLSRDMEENYNTQGIIVDGAMRFYKPFIDQLIHYLPRGEIYIND